MQRRIDTRVLDPRSFKGGRSFDTALVILARAHLLARAGQRDQAIRELDVHLMRFGPKNDYVLNLQINRAAYLAQSGRFKEALDAIDAAGAAYATSGSGKVRGSDRNFAWVRACALNGLGRRDEAAADFVRFGEAQTRPGRRVVLQRDESIRIRGYLCMGDEDALARELIAAAPPLASGALLMLQPHQSDERYGELGRRAIAAVRLNPGVAAAYQHRRELPPIFRPALNNWNTPEKPVTVTRL